MLCTTNIVFGMESDSSKMYTIQILTTYLRDGESFLQTVNKDGTLTKSEQIDQKNIPSYNKGQLTIPSKKEDKFNLSYINTTTSSTTDVPIEIPKKQSTTMLENGLPERFLDRKFIIQNQENLLCPFIATFEKKSLHSYLVNKWAKIIGNKITPNILVGKIVEGVEQYRYIARNKEITEFKDQLRIKDHNNSIIGKIHYKTTSLNLQDCPCNLQVNVESIPCDLTNEKLADALLVYNINLFPKEINAIEEECNQGQNVYLEYENGKQINYIQIYRIFNEKNETSQQTNETIEEKSKVFQFLAITFGITGLAFLAACLMIPGFGTKFLERIMSFVH